MVMMLDIFGGLKRAFRRRPVSIDNTVFRFHWLLTSAILVAFSLAVAARQYVGDPIACLPVSQVPSKILDTYCWIHSTFSIPSAFLKKVGIEVVYPGVDNSVKGEKKYYAYYQWVCFVLFLQAVLFYIPHYLWELWEGGLLKAITTGMSIVVVTDEERKAKKKILLDYLIKTLRCHQFYAWKYFFCEFLCLVNVVGQMYLMNRFFDGEFLRYGIKVVRAAQMTEENKFDHMMFIFPRMTKCTFHHYGSSGDIQTYDSICILPLNIINEKIYLFMWFWFIILAVLTAMIILLHLLVMVAPKSRTHFLHARCRFAKKEHIEIILSKTHVGDWFLLYMLGKNLDSSFFRDVVADLAKHVEREGTRENENMII